MRAIPANWRACARKLGLDAPITDSVLSLEDIVATIKYLVGLHAGTETLPGVRDGKPVEPGPQNGRYGSDPKGGVTSLKDHEAGRAPHNASVALATGIGDTVKRIDGTEVPLLTPWLAGDK